MWPIMTIRSCRTKRNSSCPLKSQKLINFGTDAGRKNVRTMCFFFRAGSCARQADGKYEKRPLPQLQSCLFPTGKITREHPTTLSEKAIEAPPPLFRLHFDWISMSNLILKWETLHIKFRMELPFPTTFIVVDNGSSILNLLRAGSFYFLSTAKRGR